jgi:pyridoxine 5-phosphate synthase
MIRLNVNIDHIATLRQARKAFEPSVVTAAVLIETAGASGVTVHLRNDRRHIQEEDVRVLRSVVKSHLNMEMAVTEEMIHFACDVKPNVVTLVPESPNEITTQGGLDILAREAEIARATERLKEAGIFVSIFIDPLLEQVEAAHRVGADQIEICTAHYSELTDLMQFPDQEKIQEELNKIAVVAYRASQFGLKVAAGHGLTYRNVQPICDIYPMEELNIGHNIVARAALVGLEKATREMLAAMNAPFLTGEVY